MQAALDDAYVNTNIDGSPDRVAIGPGFFELAGGFRTEGGADLSIVGSGPGDTVLRATDTGDPSKMGLKLKASFRTSPAAALSGLRIEMVGPSSGGIEGVAQALGRPGERRPDGPRDPGPAGRASQPGNLRSQTRSSTPARRCSPIRPWWRTP